MRLSKRGKRRLFVLFVAALLLAVAGAAFSAIKRAQQQRMATASRSEGLQAYRAGNLQIAIDKLSYYFTQHKDDLEVNLVFAEARARQPLPGGRHLFEAVDLYTNHALDLLDRRGEPDAAERRDILVRLLELYAQLGDRERVASTAEAILKFDPNMVQALAARAEVHFLAREFEQAESLANRLIEIDPDSLTWRKMLLEVRSRQGESTAAQIEQCRVWSEQYTADARFRLLAAAMLVDAGRMDDARAELHKVGSLSANTREVLEQLVSLLDVLGLHDEATDALAASAARFPDQWWPHELSIRRAWHRDEPEAALSEIAAARASLANEPIVIRRLEAVALIADGRREDALAVLQPLITMSAADKAMDEDRRWAGAVAAVLSAGAEDWRVAVESLQVAIAASPHDPVLQFLLGDANARVGEQARAIAAYQQAYTSSPNWVAAGVACSRAMLDAGRLDEAFNIARVTVTRSGIDRLQPFLQYARCVLALREAGMPAESIAGGEMLGDIAQALVEIDAQYPGEPEIATMLVRAHLAASNVAAAEAFIQQAIASQGASADVLLALADVAQQNGLAAERALLERARKSAGLTVPIAFRLADLARRDGRSAEGLALIDQAIATAKLEPASQRAAIQCARAAFLIRMNEPSALASLGATVTEFADSADVQRFALAQPKAWDDQRLIAQAMGNLHRLLGDESVQVRLAEANFLLRHQGRDRAMVSKAAASIAGVLEQSPDSLAGLSLAAEAAMMMERPDLSRAADCLERAAGVYPGEPSILVRLISTLQRQGRFDAARRHLQALSAMVARNPGFEVELVDDELRLLQAQGDFEAAMVRAAAVVDADSPPPQQLLLAAVQERTGRVAEAEAVYERLIAAHPSDALVLTQAAEFFASTGRYARGAELITRLPTLGAGRSYDLLLGAFQQRHGHVEEAGETLRKAVAADERNADAHDELARHYLAIDEPMKAREQAIAGLKADGAHTGLRSTLAVANLALPGADRAEAIKLLRELAQGGGDGGGGGNDALLAMLEILERVPTEDGRSVPSAENLVAARQLTDSHGLFLPAWQMAMAMHVEAGRMNDAITIAREAIGRLPGEPAPAEWATLLLMGVARWDEALAEAQEWRRRTLADPVAADAAAARIFIVKQRSEEAASLLSRHEQRLLQEREQHPDRLATLIEALVRSGDIANAERIITPLLDEQTFWRTAWMEAAGLMDAADAERVLNGMGDRVKSLEERLALATAWLSLANQSGSEAHLDHADSFARMCEKDASTAVGALIVLGAVAEARGDLLAAETAYRAAVDAAPQNAVALNNLAFVLASQNRGEQAVPLIEVALKLQPDQPDFLDTYAIALKGVNRFADAEAALRRALVARPDDPALMLSLVDVQLAQGNRDDAALTFSQVQRRSASLDRQTLRRLEETGQRLAESPSSGGDAANSTSAESTSKPTVP